MTVDQLLLKSLRENIWEKVAANFTITLTSLDDTKKNKHFISDKESGAQYWTLASEHIPVHDTAEFNQAVEKAAEQIITGVKEKGVDLYQKIYVLSGLKLWVGKSIAHDGLELCAWINFCVPHAKVEQDTYVSVEGGQFPMLFAHDKGPAND